MSEAGILKPASSQSLNTIEDFQTRERRAEEGNKPSDGELMKPEEGYDHTWINVEGKSDKTPCQWKESKKKIGRPRKHLVSNGSHFTSRMSEAGILKPASSQSLNTIEDFQTRERRAEEGNKPSDGEQLMPVSDSLKRAEEENKPSDGGFRSASTKKRSNSGETSKKRKRKCSPSEMAARKQAEKLVGSRIKVNYDDGDVEDLDLSIERWELIRDVNSAVDEQETVAGFADLSEIKLDHVTNSDRSARSTCKARDGAKLPVLKQEVEQRKVSRSNSAPSKSKRAKDASVELPVVKQEVEKRKVIRIKPTHQRVRDAAAELPVGEEGEKPKNKRRRTKKATPRFPVLDSEKVNVKGYQVKASAAPILEEIFEKHGDIAANYPYPSRGFRTSVFEVICDVIRQLRTNDLGIIVSMVGQMRTEVSDTAAAAHLEVSMLKQILDDILTEGDGQLVSVIRNTSLVSKAARKDLTQRKAELVIAERSYEEAKRQLERAEQSKRTAERAVEVLESVKKKAQNDMELNFNKRNDLHNSLQTFEGFRVRENNGIVRVHCEDSGKELFAEKSQWCRSEPNSPAHDGSFNTLLCGDQVNQTQTRRRVRKPNSLMKPEEGYDLTWISAERRSDKTPCQVKPSKKRTARPPKHSVSMGDFSSVSQSLNSIEDLSTRESCAGEENKLSAKTSKKSKRKCSPSEKAARPLAEELVGCRIKAWEPEDKMFYEGRITSYDKSENKHRINCDDGSVKDMNLSVERWEPIRDYADEQKTLAAVDE
nr:microtubule-associated protein futsch-like isoform X3 [Ipomoea batatas]